MSEDAKAAKAEAKAAAAKAKALRPWFKKKRYWLLAVIAVIVIAAAAGAGSSDSDKDSASSGSAGATSDTISKGLGSKDASGDIDDVSCEGPDELGFTNVSVKVTNRSSKPSTYFITIVAESADGSTRYDDTIISVMALNPEQTMTETSSFLNEIPSGAVCKVSEVQRTAS